MFLLLLPKFGDSRYFPSPGANRRLVPRFAPAKSSPGGMIEQGCGGSSPRLGERSIPALRHPGILVAQPFLPALFLLPAGTVGTRICLSYCFEIVVAGL